MQSTLGLPSSLCTKILEMACRKSSGSAKLAICTSTTFAFALWHMSVSGSRSQVNRHLKDSPQGLQVKFGMEFSSLEWQLKSKHGKHVLCLFL